MKVGDVVQLPAMFAITGASHLVSNPNKRAYAKRLEERSVFIKAIKEGDFDKLKTVNKELVSGEFNSRVYSLVVYAAIAGRQDMVEFLVQLEPNIRSVFSGFRYAAGKAPLPIIQFLVEKGAQPIVGEEWDNYSKNRYFDSYNFSHYPLAVAAEAKKWDVVEFLLQKANQATKGRFANLVLLYAGDSGDPKLAEIALGHGAQVNAKSSLDENFLFMAMNETQDDKLIDQFFKIAVQYKLDGKSKNKNNETVVEVAQKKGGQLEKIANRYRDQLR